MQEIFLQLARESPRRKWHNDSVPFPGWLELFQAYRIITPGLELVSTGKSRS
jgi:hypothetical protein